MYLYVLMVNLALMFSMGDKVTLATDKIKGICIRFCCLSYSIADLSCLGLYLSVVHDRSIQQKILGRLMPPVIDKLSALSWTIW